MDLDTDPARTAPARSGARLAGDRGTPVGVLRAGVLARRRRWDLFLDSLEGRDGFLRGWDGREEGKIGTKGRS